MWRWIILSVWAHLALHLEAAQPLSTNRAQVTVVQNSSATSLFIADPPTVRRMVDKGITAFTGKPSIQAAWRSLVATNDIVGIKVHSAPGSMVGTRPAVVEAVIQSLQEAGFPASQILIWDKRRYDLRSAGWPELADKLGVRCLAASEIGWDASKYYENPLLGRPLFDELEFDKKGEGVGRRSHLSRLITQKMTKIISVAPALNHNQAGVIGHLLGLGLGSFDNTLRFESHPDRLAESIPELVATPELFDRLVLCLTDALICQYRGEDRTLLHYAIALNELRFSKDPVALDVLVQADLENARKANPTDGEKPVKTELFNNCELLELGVADPKRIIVTNTP